ncbi:MAG: ZIP family metal transporter [Candidatus Bathyarchaeota archaeon]|nr:MAG: ZIP family metal transporter [Candidatus Bathyarchaeota archaeon]
MWAWIITATFLISLLSFIGALVLFLREKIMNKILMLLVSFSAGALIGGAFLHLIPEAIHEIGVDESSLLLAFSYLLIGFCTFFVLEQLISWHHHHATSHPKIMPFSYLILFSDGIHNFIDGLVIAAAFMLNLHIGATTSLAIALHEIPQEIGDFGILIHGGFDKVKALILNYISAVSVVFGGIVGFILYEQLGSSIAFLLPFAAGNFIYISSTDLIPEIRFKESLVRSLIRFIVFLCGIGLMIIIRFTSHH